MPSLNGIADDDVISQARAIQCATLLRLARLGVDAEAMLLAPSLDERFSAGERSRDELMRLEEAAEAYLELTGRDLLDDTRAPAALLPRPTSWLEASGAELALSLAAKLLESRTPGHGTEVLIAEHNEHRAAAQSTLAALCRDAGSVAADLARSALQHWAEVAESLLESEVLRAQFRAELTQCMNRLRVQRHAA